MKKEISKLKKQESSKIQKVDDAGVSSESFEHIVKMLQTKADKSELERLYEVKSNKVDFENILDIQQIMSKHFKHVMVLLIEISNCQLAKPNETR